MTPKARFLAGITRRFSDRVPVAPDTSNYIPCKRTGLPYWDIYLYKKIPLWKAYLHVTDWLGSEAWMASCCYAPLVFDQSRLQITNKDSYRDDIDAMVRDTLIRTPDGDLTSQTTVMRRDPPSPTIKPIRDLQRDWIKFKWMHLAPIALDTQTCSEMRSECERRNQAWGVSVTYPGFHTWMNAIEGGVEPLSFALSECPEILDEWHELDLAHGTLALELLLTAKPDYILFGGSGTITLASPSLAKKYAIPALAKWSKMCREAGVPTMLHSCGKSRVLVDLLVEHTCIDSVNPLEIAPMGDVDLAEVKRSRGRQISLMGNLHTTRVMLQGGPADVRRAALRAMHDAGEGGGFILSTGDQCGRDTPDENLLTLIDTAKQFGRYDAAGRLPDVADALAERVAS